MFASLLRARNRQRRPEPEQHSPYSTFYRRLSRSGRNRERDEDEDPHQLDEQYETEDHYETEDQEEDDEDELEDEDEDEHFEHDEDGEETPLLPIFAAEHLDKLPIYNMTHSIRLLVVRKCETTLSWDQLRSPQISAFLVKPIQEQIRTSDSLLNRATLYVLLANTLQFLKEGQTNPGNIGVSKTRALVCELLAMRMLKEFSTRELIDALSYDFHPLQGMATGMITPRGPTAAKSNLRAVRVSGLEIAIRAESKKFLAHPLVVQQLEAIWAGNIVFHTAADNYHRRPASPPLFFRSGYGTLDTHGRSQLTTLDPTLRRSATLYDPRDASLFKLSRLRVPRYRLVFSTLSYAVMLGLFLAVLVRKKLEITILEVLFWFWSAGYMLDEIVGFTEQGFGLYMMSVWNALDIGILAFFILYYALRICSIILDDEKDHLARMAYDVLAATSVLLIPRLFNLLDHIRYFSQILIAFRMMTRDLLAILGLIVIACSGFFVIFALNFGGSDVLTARSAAYVLFQILMGYSPAAWEVWDTYNPLGKAVLGCFLILANFIIVTILVTVMTNSFMAIVQNAEHEHLYLFAVNTISMVKSEALFSYVAPTNIFAWLFTPLRYVMPFRRFIKVNRTFIKFSHFPILFAIFAYERLILARSEYAPAERVERGRPQDRAMPAFSMRGTNMFSPGTRLREPSIGAFHKDRALEEVFRKPFQGREATETQPEEGTIATRRKSTVVQDWMQRMDNASPPMEQPQSIVDRLETRPETRPGIGRERSFFRSGLRKVSDMARSANSDPEDIRSISRPAGPRFRAEVAYEIPTGDGPHATDAEGDDEADDNETEGGFTAHKGSQPQEPQEVDYFTAVPQLSQPRPDAMASTPRAGHRRQISTNTILFSPEKRSSPPKPLSGISSSGSASPTRPRPRTAIRNDPTTPRTPVSRTPKRASAFVMPAPTIAPVTQESPTPPNGPAPAPRFPVRRGMPPRQMTSPAVPQAIPIPRPSGLDGTRGQNGGDRGRGGIRGWGRAPSISALDLASDLGDNHYRPDAGLIGAMPASFTTAQMAFAGFGNAPPGPGRGRGVNGVRGGARGVGAGQPFDSAMDEDEQASGGEAGMVSRIMLARMNTLEEGFREILNEVRDLRRAGGGNSTGGSGWATASGPTSRSLEDEPIGAGQGAGQGAGPRRKKRERKTTGRRVLRGERLKDEPDPEANLEAAQVESQDHADTTPIHNHDIADNGHGGSEGEPGVSRRRGDEGPGKPTSSL